MLPSQRKFSMISVIIIGLVLLLAGCAKAPLSEESHADPAKPFELGAPSFNEELRKNSRVFLIDVRQPQEYEEEHIEGAILLPLKDLSQSALEKQGIKKDDKILVYCRSGKRSAQAYEILNALGYSSVKSLNGGIIHWKEDGFPVMSGSHEDADTFHSDTTASDVPLAVQGSREFDFGQIPQYGGNVSTKFTVRNDGASSLEIGGISTSCSCTSAVIDKRVIAPGESGTITVTFNPNLHTEPADRFSRTLFVPTNDPAHPELEYRIWVDIKEGE